MIGVVAEDHLVWNKRTGTLIIKQTVTYGNIHN